LAKFGNSETSLDQEESQILDRGNPHLGFNKVLEDFLAQVESGTLLLLGESGLGKTFSVYQFVDNLLSQWWRYIKEPRVIMPSYYPLFIRPKLDQWSHGELTGAIDKIFDKMSKQYGESLESIRNKPWLVIVDGYDECQEGIILQNLPEQMGINLLPHVKLVVTCRLDTIKSSMQSAHFALNGRLTIRYFLPFHVHQMLRYLKNALQWDKKTYELYQEMLDKTTELRQVLRNPFVLSLLVQSWETISKKDQKDFDQLNRWQIYQGFTEHWIKHQQFLLLPSIQKTLSQGYEDLLDSFNAFASEIAFEAFKEKVWSFKYDNGYNLSPHTRLWLNLGEKVTEHSRKTFALRKNIQENAKRSLLSEKDFIKIMELKLKHFELSSPLKRRNTSFDPSHKSFLEYFIARRIIELRKKENTYIFEEGLQLLNARPLQKESEILRFMIEAWQEPRTRKLQKPFFKIILESIKKHPDVSQAASNAITFLNAARVSFSGEDLSGIRIPEADLSGGIFEKTNFRGADLKNVTFSTAWLYEADFKNADMQEVNLEEQPMLSLRNASSCKYSPDGKYLAIAHGSFISIYNVSPIKELIFVLPKSARIFPKHTGLVTEIEFSPNSSFLISGEDDGDLILWDVKNGMPIKVFTGGHTKEITGIIFSRDGKRLFSGSKDGSIKSWKTFEMRMSLARKDEGGGEESIPADIPETDLNFMDEENNSPITCIALCPEGKLIASGDDQEKIKIWDANTGMLLRRLKKPNVGKKLPLAPGEIHFESPFKTLEDEEIVWSISFSLDGKFLVSASGQGTNSYDSSIKIWEVSTGLLIQPLLGHTFIPRGVVFSKDGKKLVSCGNDGTIKLWNFQTGSLVKTFGGHLDKVIKVSYSIDNEIASVGLDGIIRFWKISDHYSPKISSFTEQIEGVLCVALSKNGKYLASGSQDGTIKIWYCETGKIFKILKGHELGVNSVAFSPDNKKLVSGGIDKRVILWDVESRDNKILPYIYNDSVESVIFSFSGDKIAAGSHKGEITLFNVDAEDAEPKIFFSDPWYRLYSVSFSPNDEQVIIGGLFIKILETTTNISKKLLDAPYNSYSVVFSFDGNQFLSGGKIGCDINLCSTEDGTVIKIFRGHTRKITSIAYLSNEYFVSGSEDGRIIIWNIANNAYIEKKELNAGIRSIGISITATGFYLAVGSINNVVSYWSLDLNAKESTKLRIVWSSRPWTLMAKDTKLHETKLSSINTYLLLQYGAIGKVMDAKMHLSLVQSMLNYLPEEQGLELTKQGMRYYEDKEFDRAFHFFKAALDLKLRITSGPDEEVIGLYHNVGVTLMLREDYQRAHFYLYCSYDLSLKLLGLNNLKTQKKRELLQQCKDKLAEVHLSESQDSKLTARDVVSNSLLQQLQKQQRLLESHGSTSERVEHVKQDPLFFRNNERYTINQFWKDKTFGSQNLPSSLREEQDIQIAIWRSLNDISSSDLETNKLFGLAPYDVPYEVGNCLFDAIQEVSDNHFNDAHEVRVAAISQLQNDSELQERLQVVVSQNEDKLRLYDGSLVDFRTPQEYISHMSNDKTWGTYLEIVSLSRVLQRPIVIFSQIFNYPHIVELDIYSGNEPIFIQRVGEHYRPMAVPTGRSPNEILGEIRDHIQDRQLPENSATQSVQTRTEPEEVLIQFQADERERLRSGDRRY